MMTPERRAKIEDWARNQSDLTIECVTDELLAEIDMLTTMGRVPRGGPMSHPICPPHCQCERCREAYERTRAVISSIMKPRSEPMSADRLQELRDILTVSGPEHGTDTRFERRLVDALAEAVAEIDRLRDQVAR